MFSLANFLVEKNVHCVVGGRAITAHSQETLSFYLSLSVDHWHLLPASQGSLAPMAIDTHGSL